MNIILHPSYFPSIANFIAITKASGLLFETEDNYQKQTLRNRAYIYGANGKLALNVPINHSQKHRQKYRDVKIANDTKWQELHWKSILTAYSTSPFFEFYQDEIIPIFNTKKDSLFDLNMECIKIIAECLDFDFNYNTTTEFVKNYNGIKDYRSLVNAKKEVDFNFDKYTQVFSDKHGFLSNLSILDLLFNEGPNALVYLEKQSL